MRIFKPLQRRAIALLWSGQVTSCIGDELHKVAFIWLAAGILGNDTGYLASLQAASVFVLSVFGGVWADQWNHKKTMIWVDVIRGLTVLALPAYAIFGQPGLWILLPVAVVVSGLDALFSPALRAIIPEIASEGNFLQSTNGLMETTGRLARIIGPGLIGFLSGVIPLIQFFTIDALSFFVSATSLAMMDQLKAEPPAQIETQSFKDGVMGGWDILKSSPILRYVVICNSIVNPAWYLVFPLALGLELHEKMPGNVGALGFVVAAYGVGNVLSNIAVGSFHMERPALFCWLGRAVCGAGFVGLALAPNLHFMMLASAIAATGGPMTDLSFLALLQKDFKGRDIAKIFRLNMAITYGCLLICYAASPALFKIVSYPSVIATCGLAMIGVALVGFARYGKGPRFINVDFLPPSRHPNQK